MIGKGDEEWEEGSSVIGLPLSFSSITQRKGGHGGVIKIKRCKSRRHRRAWSHGEDLPLSY